MEFLTSGQKHQLQQRFNTKCPGYPCWAWLRMGFLLSCRKKNLLPGVLQFKAATISSSGASVPTQGSALGRQGFQEDYLIYPAAEGALVLVHQAHQHFRLLSGAADSWWVPWAVLLLIVAAPSQEASAHGFPASSGMDRHEHWKCNTLVSYPAAMLVYQLIFHTASEECSTAVS